MKEAANSLEEVFSIYIRSFANRVAYITLNIHLSAGVLTRFTPSREARYLAIRRLTRQAIAVRSVNTNRTVLVVLEVREVCIIGRGDCRY